MKLFIHILIHVFLSLAGGLIVIFLFGGQLLLFITASLIGGVLVDFDHLFDYFLAFGFRFRLKYFLGGYQFLKSNRVYLPLHSWELVILLFLLSFFYRIFLAASLSLFTHLLSDALLNEFPLGSYFLVWRMKNHFNAVRLVPPKRYLKHELKKKEVMSKNDFMVG